ncbi:hypothetical protein KKA14_20020 [bacterium]|nr:hypothetical protein [bacterium]
MKNIFEYLLTKEGTLNETVFESFSNWMFDGNDSTNKLSRIFLRWTVLYIIQNAGNKKLTNDDFYTFFQEFERTEFDSFLNHVSKFGVIAVLVEQTLGSDQKTGFSGDNQSTYWYFLSRITEHIENKNLFPEEGEKKTNILKFDAGKKKTTPSSPKENPLSADDQKKVSGIFGMIFLALVLAFLVFNFLK